MLPSRNGPQWGGQDSATERTDLTGPHLRQMSLTPQIPPPRQRQLLLNGLLGENARRAVLVIRKRN